MSPPKIGAQTFACPYCRVVSQQEWNRVCTTRIYNSSDVVRAARATSLNEDIGVAGDATFQVEGAAMRQYTVVQSLQMSVCVNCNGICLWLRGSLIFPVKSTAPEPNPDVPEAVAEYYAEAARVLPHSPRAASALLRLATEKLLGHILGKSNGIDSMIADFVKFGANPTIIKAMDVLRVTGNEAVHPGTMSSVDDQATAISLFGLINLITETQITQPKHVQNLFDNLPEGKRAGIEQRNKRAIGD